MRYSIRQPFMYIQTNSFGPNTQRIVIPVDNIVVRDEGAFIYLDHPAGAVALTPDLFKKYLGEDTIVRLV